MVDIKDNELVELQKSGKKILLDLWAPWCGPCRTLIPRLENLNSKYDNVEFVKINVDENRDFALQQGIRSVPTVIIFDGGNEISRLTGAQSDDSYTKILDSL